MWLLYHWLLKAVAGVVIGLIHFLRKRTRQEVKALIIQMLSFSFFTRKNSPPPHHKSATENFYFWPNFYSRILGWFWCHLDDTACSAVKDDYTTQFEKTALLRFLDISRWLQIRLIFSMEYESLASKIGPNSTHFRPNARYNHAVLSATGVDSSDIYSH